MQFQLHVKLLLTSRCTQLDTSTGLKATVTSHSSRPWVLSPSVQTVPCVQQVVRTKRHFCLLPTVSLLPFIFFHPKSAAVGSGAGLGSLLCSPGRGTKIQVTQAGSDTAPSHAEGQTCCPFSPCAPLPANKAKQKQMPQTITASHPARAPGQEVTGGIPGPLLSPKLLLSKPNPPSSIHQWP